MSGSESWRDELRAGCSSFQPPVAPVVAEQLIPFIQLILKWNAVFNLTGSKDPLDLVRRHVLDSLAVVPYIKGSFHLDVGTGAGFPGIPLAIALPSSRFVLVDSNGKKTRFINQAIVELGLTNVEVRCTRVEKLAAPRCFDTIVSRAVADVAQLVSWCAPLCCETGRMVWMKGPNVVQDEPHCPAGWRIGEIAMLPVPGLDAERYAVIVERQL